MRRAGGSDFPYVLIGGNEPTESGCSYAEASGHLAAWGDVPGLDDEGYRAIMGGNAALAFGFWS